MRPGTKGCIERAKLQEFSFSYFQVCDSWKTSTGIISKPVYVYKVTTKTALSDKCKLSAIPPKKVVQGFCIRQELEDFSSHCVLPRGNSVFVALTPAMEKRTRHNRCSNVVKAYNAHAHPPMFRSSRDPVFFCKNPYDMLKNKKARVCFWEYVPSVGYVLSTVGGKLIAK